MKWNFKNIYYKKKPCSSSNKCIFGSATKTAGSTNQISNHYLINPAKIPIELAKLQ